MASLLRGSRRSLRQELQGLLADHLIGWAFRLDPDRFYDEDGLLHVGVLAPTVMDAHDARRRRPSSTSNQEL